MMKYFLFSVLCALVACNLPTKPNTAKQDYDCKHCGMPSQDHPQWQAKIELEKETFWFCSPRCMFSRYHELQAGQARRLWVKDYYTLKFIDAKKAYFVQDSKILGPMGADFVPFGQESAAQDFLKEHTGKKILPFQEITPQRLK